MEIVGQQLEAFDWFHVSVLSSFLSFARSSIVLRDLIDSIGWAPVCQGTLVLVVHVEPRVIFRVR